jgi:hypothetical protein
VKHALAAFQLKNKKYNEKILKRPHGPLNYTKYLRKNTKIPPKTKLFFVFSEVKSVIFLYIKIEKNLKYPYPPAHYFLILEIKKYFYYYKYYKKPRKPLVNISKFY